MQTPSKSLFKNLFCNLLIHTLKCVQKSINILRQTQEKTVQKNGLTIVLFLPVNLKGIITHRKINELKQSSKLSETHQYTPIDRTFLK